MILSVVALTIVISAAHNYGHEDDISSENEKLRNEITLQGYFFMKWADKVYQIHRRNRKLILFKYKNFRKIIRV